MLSTEFFAQTGKLSDYVERRVLATVLGLVSVYGQRWPTTLEVGSTFALVRPRWERRKQVAA